MVSFAVLLSLLGLLGLSPVLTAAMVASVRQELSSSPSAGLLEQASELYQRDCGQVRVPGAGLDPVVAGGPVLKDGFFSVACVKDYMLGHADKSGDGKFEYAEGALPNVSIVNYADVVAKEDREPMTPAVCFKFCRSVPDMLFFGLTQGRYCYCSPYYKQVAGDSSECDAVCEADPTVACGGMTKSSIYEMHQCADARETLLADSSKASKVLEELKKLASKVMESGQSMQSMAGTLQKSFGAVGDTVASDLMQSAKKYAGVVLHSGEAGEDFVKQLSSNLEAATAGLKETTESVPKLEGHSEKLQALTVKGQETAESLTKTAEEAEPAANSTEATQQYYPVMYFVEKSAKDMPSTCGGTASQEPLVSSFDGCATACDAEGDACSAFSYFVSDDSGLCFLFSKLTSATYYTGCSPVFLQKSNTTKKLQSTQCMAKLEDYEKTSLKPDPSGKCKGCLKKVTKADRCFAA